MKNMWLWIVVLVIIAGAYYFMTTNKPQDALPVEPGEQVMKSSIVMNQQNNSGESGIVQMVESGGKVTVTVTIEGAPATEQPAHIHSGVCPVPGQVVYPLTNLVNGMSETVLNTTLSQLKSQLPLAVNVHKSADEMKAYVSCGDLAL